jgi:hypothetical protein
MATAEDAGGDFTAEDAEEGVYRRGRGGRRGRRLPQRARRAAGDCNGSGNGNGNCNGNCNGEMLAHTERMSDSRPHALEWVSAR